MPFFETMPRSSRNKFAKKIRPYAILIAAVVIVLAKFGARLKEDYFPTADSNPSATSQTRHIGNYEVLEDCQWIDNRGNDGDSFLVKHGRDEYTFRLYFVDSPEKYLSDKYKDQRKRVAQQGEYFGGLSPDQAVEIGLKAKAFTAKKLKGKSFTILTAWESVYSSNRYYAFVLLPGSTEEKPLRLCEALIENGLARIYTKGPGGKGVPGFQQAGANKKDKGFQRHLHQLQSLAKKSKEGAWGVK